MNLNKLNNKELSEFSYRTQQSLENIQANKQDERLCKLMVKLAETNRTLLDIPQKKTAPETGESANSACKTMIESYSMIYYAIKANTFYPEKRRRAYADRMMKLLKYTPHQLERLKRTEQIAYFEYIKVRISRFSGNEIEVCNYVSEYNAQFKKLEIRIDSGKASAGEQTLSKKRKLIIETNMHIYNYLQSAYQVLEHECYKEYLRQMELAYAYYQRTKQRKENRVNTRANNNSEEGGEIRE